MGGSISHREEPNTDATKALPKTGEESNFGWLLALVLVIAGVAVLFGYKKTRKQ